jgi:hypothetical protein
MKTYIIDSIDNIPNNFFIEYLNTNKNWTSSDSQSVDFVYVTRNKKYYELKRGIANYFDSSHHMKYLTDKSALIHTITEFSPTISKTILVPSYDIKQSEITDKNLDKYKQYFDEYKIMILRPTWGFARRNIMIFNDFAKFKTFMLSEGLIDIRKQKSTDCFVLSQYMTNLMHYKERVFHLRAWLFISKINNIYYAGTLRFIKAILGKIKYSESIKNINTTTIDGLVSSSEYVNFTELFNDIEDGKTIMDNVFKQVEHIMKILFHIIKKHDIMKHYENVVNTCEIFGLDFIITDDYVVKLIEFNHKPGLKNFTEIYHRQLVGLYIDLTINKLYKPPYNITIPYDVKSEFIFI